MKKFVPVMIALIAVAVGWIFFANFRVRGWDGLRVIPKPDVPIATANTSPLSMTHSSGLPKQQTQPRMVRTSRALGAFSPGEWV